MITQGNNEDILNPLLFTEDFISKGLAVVSTLSALETWYNYSNTVRLVESVPVVSGR